MIVVVSVLLGAVFVTSGVMKVAAPRQWRSQSSEFGVPSVIAAVVPYAELIVGALLVAQIARRAVAGVAAGLLVAFTALLIVRLAQGRHPTCACFGVWSSRPIGWGNVVRNASFLGLAAVVVLRLV